MQIAKKLKTTNHENKGSMLTLTTKLTSTNMEKKRKLKTVSFEKKSEKKKNKLTFQKNQLDIV